MIEIFIILWLYSNNLETFKLQNRSWKFSGIHFQQVKTLVICSISCHLKHFANTRTSELHFDQRIIANILRLKDLRERKPF